MQGNHLTDIALGICQLGAPFILATFLIQKVFLLGLDVQLDGCVHARKAAVVHACLLACGSSLLPCGLVGVVTRLMWCFVGPGGVHSRILFLLV